MSGIPNLENKKPSSELGKKYQELLDEVSEKCKTFGFCSLVNSDTGESSIIYADGTSSVTVYNGIEEADRHAAAIEMERNRSAWILVRAVSMLGNSEYPREVLEDLSLRARALLEP